MQEVEIVKMAFTLYIYMIKGKLILLMKILMKMVLHEIK